MIGCLLLLLFHRVDICICSWRLSRGNASQHYQHIELLASTSIYTERNESMNEVPVVAEKTRILVVDDAADTRLLLNLRLQREGYEVFTASSGTEALEMIQKEGLPHLVLLDIMMPGMDGFAVASELRRMGDISIIFLSALSDTDTKVEGLNRFAEDYVTKPFDFTELSARIRRVLLRVATDQNADPEQAIDDRLAINFAQQYAILDGAQITLTPTENRLVHILYNNRGRVLSPGFLLAKAWDPVRRGTVESLWVHMRRLRSKIEPDADNPRYVVTVRGQGYCLPQRINTPEGEENQM